MPLYYIQTWIIKDDKSEEHENSIRMWLKRIYNIIQLKPIRYFNPVGGPERSRVLIFGFNDSDEFLKFHNTILQDKCALEYMHRWLRHIKIHTYNITFWRKELPEDLKRLDLNAIINKFTSGF